MLGFEVLLVYNPMVEIEVQDNGIHSYTSAEKADALIKDADEFMNRVHPKDCDCASCKVGYDGS